MPVDLGRPTPSEPSRSAPRRTPFLAPAPAILRGLILLLPVLALALLVARHAVDVRFVDDWMMAESLIEKAEGTLSLSSLMAVQMEHRLFVPKLITLALHALAGPDMRWQMAASVALMAGAYGHLIWLLRRAAGPGRMRQWWLPALLMGLCLLSPVQWQTLLYAVCFTSTLPAFCLTGALVCWFSNWPRPLALTGAALLAATATFSFATGVLIWFWMLALILADPALPPRQRLLPALCWLGAMAACLLLYFADFGNTVASHYAYGGGQDGTFARAAGVFLSDPLASARFVLAFLGGHLCRGLPFDSVATATTLGLASVLVCAAAALVVLAGARREPRRWREALPWLLLASHAVATGVMIALGRMWVTSSPVQAITVRYTAYSLWITVGMVGLCWAAARAASGWRVRRAAWLPPLRAAGTATAMLLLLGWAYGSVMMAEWQAARLQGVARLLFLNLLPDSRYLGALGIQGGEIARLARRLDAHGLLSPRPLQSADLEAEFQISRSAMQSGSGRFEAAAWDTETGDLLCSGFCRLPGTRRPADGVVLATRSSPGTAWTIAGLISPDPMPRHLEVSTRRDYEFITSYRWTAEETCRWLPRVELVKPLPAGAELSAWALDAAKRRLYRVPSASVVMRTPPAADALRPEKNQTASAPPAETPATGKASVAARQAEPRPNPPP